MIASLQADLENVSFASDCTFFLSHLRLECRTGARNSSYNALGQGILLDRLDNVQITLYPGANT